MWNNDVNDVKIEWYKILLSSLQRLGGLPSTIRVQATDPRYCLVAGVKAGLGCCDLVRWETFLLESCWISMLVGTEKLIVCCFLFFYGYSGFRLNSGIPYFYTLGSSSSLIPTSCRCSMPPCWDASAGRGSRWDVEQAADSWWATGSLMINHLVKPIRIYFRMKVGRCWNVHNKFQRWDGDDGIEFLKKVCDPSLIHLRIRDASLVTPCSALFLRRSSRSIAWWRTGWLHDPKMWWLHYLGCWWHNVHSLAVEFLNAQPQIAWIILIYWIFFSYLWVQLLISHIPDHPNKNNLSHVPKSDHQQVNGISHPSSVLITKACAFGQWGISDRQFTDRLEPTHRWLTQGWSWHFKDLACSRSGKSLHECCFPLSPTHPPKKKAGPAWEIHPQNIYI